jgi:hypothetical protein
MSSVEEYTAIENKDLFSYIDKVEYFRTLLTNEVFQKSSLHTMYVLIETQ